MIVALPGLIPVIVPAGLTPATVGGVLSQVPPGVASVTMIDCPWQTADGPKIAAGSALTVTATER